ncbi:hypothetical protein TWF281_008892 [Arthrobotrys megalospora]
MRFSILSIAALPALLGCVDGVFGLSSPQCKPVAKSCAASARQAAPCTVLFIKNKVKRPTCTVVPAAVTVTKRVTPTTTLTKTITHTVTTIATKSLPTVLATEIHETVETETSVTSVTISTTEIETITTYTTTTSTPRYDQFTCITMRKREPLPIVEIEGEFEGLVKRTAVPKCCGCFLTSTKTAARQTKTVTTTLPKVTVTKTATKTTTKTSITTGVASTSTLYETTTQFSTATETAFETTTETTTETATATETVVYDLCASPYVFNGRNAFSYSKANIVLSMIGADTVADCCRRCYNAQNCANYMFDTSNNSCRIYVISGSTGDLCSNAQCPYGKASGSFMERPVSEQYGPGPCGGGIMR